MDLMLLFLFLYITQILTNIFPLKWFNSEIVFYSVRCTVRFHRRSLFFFVSAIYMMIVIRDNDMMNQINHCSFMLHLWYKSIMW